MSATTDPTPADAGGLTPELARQIRMLPREAKEQLLSLLQEELGGPPPGDRPDRSIDDREAVRKAWQDELARRIRDVQEGKVTLVDAREAVAQTRQQIREKFRSRSLRECR